MAKLKVNKNVAIGAGVGCGMVQTFLLGEYLNWYVPELPGAWGSPAAIGNIAIGALALGLVKFTKVIKKSNLKTFVWVYGLTSVFGGLLNGLFPAVQVPATEYRNNALRVSGLTGHIAAVPGGMVASSGGTTNGQYTSTYYPGYSGNFYRRPATRAQGFGSDVSWNPKANIPTTVPYNEIIF